MALLALAMTLAACARVQTRETAVYPGEPVRGVAGTDYAPAPGLPAPPRNAEGIVPPPPPRYMGRTVEASSGNVNAAP